MPLNLNLNIIQIFFLSFGTFLFDFSIFFIIFSFCTHFLATGLRTESVFVGIGFTRPLL